MRHVRILGLCLVAVFALSAMTAGQAMAKKEKCVQYGSACETPSEHAEYQQFDNCPIENPEVHLCATGSSFEHEVLPGGKQNKSSPVSYFTAGKVTVVLKNPILLRGGMVEEKTEKCTLNCYHFEAAVGAPTIEPVAQPGPSLKDSVNTALLSPTELERFTYWSKDAKDNKTSVVVEAAGPIESLKVNLSALVFEEETGFVFPVKVHIINPFAGENCYVGSDEHPINVPYTTGQSGELHGFAGTFEEKPEETTVVWEQRLVSSEFESPGVEGCGVNDGADEAVDSALGLPSATGNTSVLNSEFKLIERERLEKGLKGEI